MKIGSKMEKLCQNRGLTDKSPHKGADMRRNKRKMTTEIIAQLREKRKKIEPKNPVKLKSNRY